MLLILYIILLLLTAIVSFFKPIYGIFIYSLIFFFLNLSNFFSDLDAYRPAFILGILLAICTFIRGYKIRQMQFVIFFILLLGITAGTYYLSHKQNEEGLNCLITLFKVCILSIIIVWTVDKRKDFIALLRFIEIGAVCNGAFAIFEQIYHIPSRIEPGGSYRSSGLQGEPNEVAGIMVAAIPISYYFFKNATNKFIRMLGLCNMFILIVGVICTVSRTALLCLILVYAGILIKNKRNIVFLVISTLMIIVLFSFARDIYLQRHSVKTTLSGKAVYDSSFVAHIELPLNGFKLWLNHPVMGIGLRNFREQARKELNISIQVGAIHNTYLQYLCETGIFGFICFISLLISAFRALTKLKHGGVFYSEIAGYLQLSLFSWCVFGLFFSVGVTAYFWFYMTLPFVLDNVFNAENKQPLAHH